MTNFPLFFALAIFIIYSPRLASQNYIETQKLQLEESIQNQIYAGEFGSSIDIDGNTAIIGSRYGGLNDNTSGIAVIYEFNLITGIWEEVKIMLAEDRASNDNFGISVSISDDLVIIGASGSESAYIYQRDHGGIQNWGLVKKIIPSDPTKSFSFGNSVAIQGELAIVGIPFGGAAYIFHQNFGGPNNWGEVKKLESDSPFSGESFGYVVDIDQEFAIVTDPFQGNFQNSGAAYIYNKDHGGLNNWGLIKSIDPERPLFGSSLSMSSHKVVIGNGTNNYIYYKDLGGLNNWGLAQEVGTLDQSTQNIPFLYGDLLAMGIPSVGLGDVAGSAIIYKEDHGGPGAWGEVTRIQANDGSIQDRFGSSIGIHGETILIGAPYDDAQGINSGSTYIFDVDYSIEDNWTQIQKIHVGEGMSWQGNDQTLFGNSVAISDNIAIIGSQRSASIFYKDNESTNQWTKIKTLVSENTTTKTIFGYNVSIDGDIALVDNLKDSVFVFMKNFGGLDNWGQISQFLTVDDRAYVQVQPISVSGTFAIVGSQSRDGKVSIHEKDMGGPNQWGIVKILKEPNDLNNYFGWSVYMDGNEAIVGAFRNNNFGNPHGAAYIFNKDEGGINNWGHAQTIYPEEPTDALLFGINVHMKDDRIVVASSNDGYIFEKENQNWVQVRKLETCEGTVPSIKGLSLGSTENNVFLGSGSNNAVYIFNKDIGGTDNWGQYKKVTASDESANEFFGISIAADKNVAIVGAFRDDDQGTNSGSAYILTDCELPQIECPEDIIVEADSHLCQVEDVLINVPLIIDSCNSVYDLSNDAPEVFAVGQTIITWSVSDCQDPFLNCQSIVFVEDNEAPIAKCKDAEMAFTDSGTISLSVNDIDGGSTDNCSIESMSLDQSSFTCENLGINQITLTVIDIHNNVNTCEAIVKIGGASNLEGLTCDDDDPCTLNDIYKVDCLCEGEATPDTDSDGFCDLIDTCQGFDDSIDLNNDGVPDRCECIDFIIENTQQEIDTDKKAIIGIQTNGQVLQINQIQYSAGDYIELKENFQVVEGATFEARIKQCK